MRGTDAIAVLLCSADACDATPLHVAVRLARFKFTQWTCLSIHCTKLADKMFSDLLSSYEWYKVRHIIAYVLLHCERKLQRVLGRW